MKFLVSIAILMLALSLHAKSLKIMQYNTENFFDTSHDPNTDDWTYLPLNVKQSIPEINDICAKMGSEHNIKECLSLDWNEARFSKKIISISKVIKSFDETGKGPDIIVLEEIENKTVLNKLVTKGLAGLGYQYQILIEGDDSRGIDIAIVSKFPIVDAKRHPIIVNGTKLNTRGILEVMINVNGQNVLVFGNHWPSQNNPTEERIASAKLLQSLVTNKKADLIVALGDFNTINSDMPAPFSFMPDFIDAEKEARKIQPTLNPGTHFFKGNWTSLDRIFIHKKSAIRPLFEKFQIMNRPFMMKRDQSGQIIPNRFNTQTGDGFSDHLPLGIEFSY